MGEKVKSPYTTTNENRSFAQSSRKTKLRPFVSDQSPDLNPIEMFWGWLRKKLRKMDLADFRNNHPPLNKAAYITRVKGVMRSQKAQTVAKSCATRLRKTCKQVVERGGAGADN